MLELARQGRQAGPGEIKDLNYRCVRASQEQIAGGGGEGRRGGMKATAEGYMLTRTCKNSGTWKPVTQLLTSKPSVHLPFLSFPFSDLVPSQPLSSVALKPTNSLADVSEGLLFPY